ncbi:hypothetical protein MHA01_13430 [Marinococcus halophilus]|uniref:Uncharacterized protein n=1 Tax=Marinococcus halophilus TaxID=1371 RepID=A0A510Y521_MARHA|nr:hypothetical protein MHA01_13430 [Marinococcus halophilus]
MCHPPISISNAVRTKAVPLALCFVQEGQARRYLPAGSSLFIYLACKGRWYTTVYGQHASGRFF